MDIVNVIRKRLYDAYLENDCMRLNLGEIKNLKIITSKDVDLIWDDIENYYEIPNSRSKKIEKEKKNLIYEVQQIVKEGKQKEPLSSKDNDKIFKKAKRLFGSWNELLMSANLKINYISSQGLNDKRKDDILEKIMLLTIKDGRIPFKSTINKYKYIPTFAVIEDICRYKWEDIISILNLELPKQYQVNILPNKDILNQTKRVVIDNNIDTLLQYSFLDEAKIEFIYIVNKMEINWNWFKVLMNNNFDCNNGNFRCNKEDILDILKFKMILSGRQLRNNEINSDEFLPNTINLMNIFNKSTYEIWMDVEKLAKVYL